MTLGTLKRRRALIGSKDYVKRGLYVHFDGINNTGNGHSDTTVTWYDLSPNKYNLALTNNVGVEWHDNYIAYSPNVKSSSWMQMPVSSEFTLEYLLSTSVAHDAVTNINFYPLTGSYSSNFNFSRIPKGVNIRIRGSRYIFEFESEPNVPHLISVAVKQPNEIAVFCDGKHIETRAVNVAALEAIQAALGYSNGENAAKKEDIKLYACRFYTRALNGSEILQNYTKDKERYSL